MSQLLSDGSVARKGDIVQVIKSACEHRVGSVVTVVATNNDEVKAFDGYRILPRGLVLCQLDGNSRPYLELASGLIQASDEDIMRYAEGRRS